ncbi:hypothetical protein BJ965_005499 [Streptomyces luteogriseus]|uniref:Uncharacterized protein n=1 Tax=Streptomyces luteogriseus TaxID=68233 RepID=A0A7W7DUI0_9ACTN|nr:hypothetical protein [Streptomyces luteogriseus]
MKRWNERDRETERRLSDAPAPTVAVTGAGVVMSFRLIRRASDTREIVSPQSFAW